MELSIIIVNWNTCALLRGCLRSVEENDSGLSIQTIVVDNNSSDLSREMVAREFPTVKLINSGGNLGFARGNNLGLPFAEAPLILFLNPDTCVSGDALKKMVGHIRSNSPIGALGCKIKGASGEVKPLGLQWFPSPLTELVRFFAISERSFRRRSSIFPYHDPEQSGYVKKLYGACLLVRREVLEKVGSFDERFFMYCEDVDLCYRMHKSGWKLFYLSEAEILHLGGSSSSQAPGAFAVLMTCESLSKLMRKHYGTLGSLTYRMVAFVGSQARIAALLFLNATARLESSQTPKRAGALKKNFMITKWTLGLQKAVIRN